MLLSEEHVGYDFLPYESALKRATFPAAKELIEKAKAEVAANSGSNLKYDGNSNLYTLADRRYARRLKEIVDIFRNGLALSGLEVLWQDFAVGVLIIVAVTIDQWIRKISA